MRYAGLLLLLLGCHGGAQAQAPAARPAAPTPAPAPAPRPTPRATPPWRELSPGLRWQRTAVQGEDSEPLEWLVVRVDLERRALGVERTRDDTLASLEADPAVLFAVDAGFFAPNHDPTGLLVEGSRRYGALSAGGGSGVLRVEGRRATLESSPALLDAGVLPAFSLGVQCGPRLLEADGSVGIYRNDGRRYARTAACLRDGGRTVDFVLTWSEPEPLRGPTLYWFARALAAAPSPGGDARGCEAALNLDGGPSTGAWLRGEAGAQHPAPGPVPWALVVRR